jgi:hypothetical protein
MPAPFSNRRTPKRFGGFVLAGDFRSDLTGVNILSSNTRLGLFSENLTHDASKFFEGFLGHFAFGFDDEHVAVLGS